MDGRETGSKAEKEPNAKKSLLRKYLCGSGLRAGDARLLNDAAHLLPYLGVASVCANQQVDLRQQSKNLSPI